MNINATLILQSIAMMIFVWFCMKFIWPPLLKALDERRERIAEGLAASDRAEKELAVPAGIEHQAVGGQGADDVGEPEMEIELLFGAERVGELVLVHVQKEGRAIEGWVEQAAQVSRGQQDFFHDLFRGEVPREFHGRGIGTGFAIRADGLILTNHHCAFRAIQEAGRGEADFLAAGFSAPDRAGEQRDVRLALRVEIGRGILEAEAE